MNIEKAKRGSPHKLRPLIKRKIYQELLSGKITAGDLAKNIYSGVRAIMRWIKWFEKEQKKLLSSQIWINLKAISTQTLRGAV